MTCLSSLNGSCHRSPAGKLPDPFMILKKKASFLVINYHLPVSSTFHHFPLSFYYFFPSFFLHFLYRQHHLPISFTFCSFIFFPLFFFLLNSASLSFPRIHTHHHHSQIHMAMTSPSLLCCSVSISVLCAVVPRLSRFSLAAAASLSLQAHLPFSRSLSHLVSIISLSLLVLFFLMLKTESLRSES
jgi:hypothetical protein